MTKPKAKTRAKGKSKSKAKSPDGRQIFAMRHCRRGVLKRRHGG